MSKPFENFQLFQQNTSAGACDFSFPIVNYHTENIKKLAEQFENRNPLNFFKIDPFLIDLVVKYQKDLDDQIGVFSKKTYGKLHVGKSMMIWQLCFNAQKQYDEDVKNLLLSIFWCWFSWFVVSSIYANCANNIWGWATCNEPWPVSVINKFLP